MCPQSDRRHRRFPESQLSYVEFRQIHNFKKEAEWRWHMGTMCGILCRVTMDPLRVIIMKLIYNLHVWRAPAVQDHFFVNSTCLCSVWQVRVTKSPCQWFKGQFTPQLTKMSFGLRERWLFVRSWFQSSEQRRTVVGGLTRHHGKKKLYGFIHPLVMLSSHFLFNFNWCFYLKSQNVHIYRWTTEKRCP